MTQPETDSRLSVRLIYVVCIGGLILGVSLGIRHTQGLFLLPITMERGWSRDAYSLAMAIQNLAWGLFQPLAGMVADRYGSHRVLRAGIVTYVAGIVLMITAPDIPLFIVGAGLAIGLGLAATAFGTVYGAVVRLTPVPQRGWALGAAGAIGGLGQFFLVPLAQIGIDSLSWQGALGSIAFVFLLLIPFTRLLRDGQPDPVAASGERMRDVIGLALRSKSFALLNVGFFACGFQLAFLANHLPAYVVDAGLAPRAAVGALAIIALTNVAGSFCFGLWGTRLRPKYLLSGLYLARVSAMAIFLMCPLSIWSLYLFSAAMGFAWLGTVPLTNQLIVQMFGVRYMATLFGFVFFGHQLGSFFGVWLGGAVYAAFGSYELVWLAAMGVGTLAAALHLPIQDSPRPLREAALPS